MDCLRLLGASIGGPKEPQTVHFLPAITPRRLGLFLDKLKGLLITPTLEKVHQARFQINSVRTEKTVDLPYCFKDLFPTRWTVQDSQSICDFSQIHWIFLNGVILCKSMPYSESTLNT